MEAKKIYTIEEEVTNSEMLQRKLRNINYP